MRGLLGGLRRLRGRWAGGGSSSFAALDVDATGRSLSTVVQ